MAARCPVHTRHILLVALVCAPLVGCGDGASQPGEPCRRPARFCSRQASRWGEGDTPSQIRHGDVKFTPNGVTGKDGRFSLSTAAS